MSRGGSRGTEEPEGEGRRCRFHCCLLRVCFSSQSGLEASYRRYQFAFYFSIISCNPDGLQTHYILALNLILKSRCPHAGLRHHTLFLILFLMQQLLYTHSIVHFLTLVFIPLPTSSAFSPQLFSLVVVHISYQVTPY